MAISFETAAGPSQCFLVGSLLVLIGIALPVVRTIDENLYRSFPRPRSFSPPASAGHISDCSLYRYRIHFAFNGWSPTEISERKAEEPELA